MRLIIGLLLASVVWGQGAAVNQSQANPPDAFTTLLFYDGSNNITYTCKAASQQPSFAWTRALSTLTSIVDAANTSTVTTSTAHGLAVGNLATISGATIATALNGTYFTQTVGSTTTFTVTTSGVADATYTEATLSAATTAPRSSAPQWDIFKFITTSSNISSIQKAGGKSGRNSICDDKSVTTGSTKITYN